MFVSNFIRLCRLSIKLTCKHYVNRPTPLTSVLLVRTIHSDDEFESSVITDREYETIRSQYFYLPEAGYCTMVVQPDIKWGPRRMKTPPNLLLEETVMLVQTLQNWTVKKQLTLSTKEPNTKLVFTSGKFAQLKEEVAAAKGLFGINTVIVSIDKLTPLQQTTLEREFKMPVFDRYLLVLYIFKEHAVTSEAKLQIALAEIPLIRSRIKNAPFGTQDRSGGRSLHTRGSGETYLELRRRLLSEKEAKLKQQLELVKSQRNIHRTSRIKKDYPVISVVGYTNAGKTSLIKALTKEQELQPKDQLFATLDVTAHAGQLLNNMTVIYMDTIGFITDIPTTLIESFKTVLNDIIVSDLIIHIKDANHPHYENQRDTVLKTLQSLDVPERLLSTMVEVDNKVDLLQNTDEARESLPISCHTGQGLNELLGSIENALMKSTNRQLLLLRVPTGGDASRWLYREGAVSSIFADETDPQYSIFEVVMSLHTWDKFKKSFAHEQVIQL